MVTGQMYRILERLRIASAGSDHPANRPMLLTDVANNCELVYVRVPDLVELLRDYDRIDSELRGRV